MLLPAIITLHMHELSQTALYNLMQFISSSVCVCVCVCQRQIKEEPRWWM